MSLPSLELLVSAVTRPSSMAALRPSQWDLLVRQARSADMLARLAINCRDQGLWDAVPAPPRRHLESALNLMLRQHRALQWEVDMVALAMARAGVPLVLLKGAAYAMSGLAAARGRMMSDVDVLVPREALPEVESALMRHGWVSEAKTAYDERYYRTWMHEVPPMRHFHRGTVIDVHHAIVPLSARAHPSSAALLAAVRPVRPGSTVRSLGPLDMLLHSASHLFHEGELHQGFRGLVDLDALLRELGATPGFWSGLAPRARELELERPLFYALRYCRLMLGTPVPDAVLAEVGALPDAPRSRLMLRWMDALFLRALRPMHATLDDAWTPAARWLLYVRGHWLRMPPWLLVPHLVRKAVLRGAPPAEVA